MAVMYYHDQKALEGKSIQRAILGLGALEAASRFAATIRAVEIERCFYGPVHMTVKLSCRLICLSRVCSVPKRLGGERSSVNEAP